MTVSSRGRSRARLLFNVQTRHAMWGFACPLLRFAIDVLYLLAAQIRSGSIEGSPTGERVPNVDAIGRW